MSRIPTSEVPGLEHLGGVVVDGEDSPVIRHIYDSVDDIPTLPKTVRLMVPLIEAIERVGHPGGFSGVMREALLLWLDKHGDPQAEIDEAVAALATLQRVVHKLQQQAG